MSGPISSPLLLAAGIGAALAFAWPAAAQDPQEPLGDLLESIPLPEGQEAAPEPEEKPTEAPVPLVPPRPPVDVPPGTVVPVELPPSTIEPPVPEDPVGDPLAEQTSPAEPADDTEAYEAPVAETAKADRAEADERSDAPADGEEVAPASAEADAAAAADAAWEALQERRRQEINAVESPVVDRLNADVAARAAAETRRIEEERAAYERSLVEAEEAARRRDAEHQAAMAEHARRVAREQAEYRARVQACLDGDRQACRPDR